MDWLILLSTETLQEMREDIIMSYAPDAPEPDADEALKAIESILRAREALKIIKSVLHRAR